MSSLPLRVWHGSSLADAPPRGAAVAIGNFDGVHLGHQQVLRAALVDGAPALALTFEPHPRDVFGREPVFRLTPEAQKAEVIGALGLDATVVAPFDGGFSAMSADAFVREVLVKALGVRAVIVGPDFSYGARRGGNVATLQAAGTALGFAVQVADVALNGEAPVSSSRIREALGSGDVTTANALLGYRYRVAAPVRHGEKRGRTLGYPTLNQRLDAANRLAHGIYAVRAFAGGAWRDGVASFGRRPTFDDGAPLLETFLFDYSGDLYGTEVETAFVAYLRGEARFDSADALVRQMDEDAAQARTILAAATPSDLERRLSDAAAVASPA